MAKTDPESKQRAITIVRQLLEEKPGSTVPIYRTAFVPRLFGADRSVTVEAERAWPIGDLIWEGKDAEGVTKPEPWPAALTADGRVERVYIMHVVMRMLPKYRLRDEREAKLVGGTPNWSMILSRLEDASQGTAELPPPPHFDVLVVTSARKYERESLRSSRQRSKQHSKLMAQKWQLQGTVRRWGLSHPNSQRELRKYIDLGGVPNKDDLGEP